MTNGNPSSDRDAYVIRSGVRTGLKRELAFALKSQAELSRTLSLSRTRSGKPSPSPSSAVPSPKRTRKSNGAREATPTVEETVASKSDGQDASPVAESPMDVDRKEDGLEPQPVVETPSAAPTNGGGPHEDTSSVKNALATVEDSNVNSKCIDKSQGEETHMEVDSKEYELKPEPAAGTPVVVGCEMEDNKPSKRFTRSALKSSVEETAADYGPPDARASPETLTTKRLTRSASKVVPAPPPSRPNESDNDAGKPAKTHTDANKQHKSKPEASQETPSRRLTRSASKLTTVDSVSTPPPTHMEADNDTGKPAETAVDVNGAQESKVDSPDTSARRLTRMAAMLITPPPTITLDDSKQMSVEASVIDPGQEEPKVENDAALKPSTKFKRLAMKVRKENTPIATDIWASPEKPGRRFTRSLLKTTTTEEPAAAGEDSRVTSGAAIGLEESRGGSGSDDGSSRSTPGKKMELKMSKKIALRKLPANVRELLGTGLLEGLPVKYNVSPGKQVGLEGVVNGNGILCSCNLCNSSKVVSAYNFELHAGSTKKHPSDFIYLENGKCLREILEECRTAPLDMLEAAIQNAIGPLPQSKPSVCQSCKKSFHTPRTGKFGLLCDSCLLPKKQLQTSPNPSQRAPSNAKLSGKALSGSASDGPFRNVSSQKKNLISSKAFVGDALDVSSKNMSSQKKSVQGKITRKDLGLHKLVFMDDILPEGTEVGYYVRGKRLLEGYIKDSGIFCRCCNSVVSPSQFEAHAGRASRRKPYNNIYTSNGVSLHELSVSLSRGRKLSANENDDLCSICADGGDLLLCDLCPRAFHKECVGLSSVPKGGWYCRYCHVMHEREKSVGYNDNAIAAGRVAGVDPIEQIIKRCIRIVTTSTDFGVCVLCRCHDFSKSGFDERTVLICDQCEKEYHVGCLKNHEMCDLKELPEGEWFCCASCSEIHAALHKSLLCGPEPLQNLHTDVIRKKREGKGLSKEAAEVRWRLLSGKTSSDDTKLLLSEAVSIFHESFDPIVDAVTGRDLIPSMVYGRSVRDQDFGGMYCAVLTVNSVVVSAGILRVLGSDVAELPLVATNRESQGQGYFQSLFSCIEKMLEALKVEHFVLPAAEEAESIWTKKFGFSKISSDQLYEFTKGARPIIFQGTSLLHKRVPLSLGGSSGSKSF